MKKVFLIGLAPDYFSILKELGKHLGTPEMRTPYILTCAATLEYLLNDLVAQFALHNYRHDDATEIAASLYTLSFKGKLITLPSLITNGRLVVNRRSSTFAALCDLISARNMLVHNKTQFAALDAEQLEEGFSIKFPVKMIKNHPLAFDEETCKRFRLALIEFTKQVHDGEPAKDFDPSRLEPSDLLRLADTKE